MNCRRMGTPRTSLSYRNSFNLPVAQTMRVDTNVPISVQRPADAQEKRDTYGSAQYQAANERKYCKSSFPRIHDS